MSSPRFITAAEVGRGELSDGISTSVLLNNEQIRNLPISQVDIVPAPGEGKVACLISATIILDARGGFYSNVSDGVSDNTRIIQVQDASTYIQNSYLFGTDFARTMVVLPSWTYIDGGNIFAEANDVDVHENAPLSLFCNNTLGALADGHADNTMLVSVLYRVVEIQ